ncbi:MAG: hypothetical protein RIR70_1367 [Pseudomonadota bacterium]|jgi:hypothetical protein
MKRWLATVCLSVLAGCSSAPKEPVAEVVPRITLGGPDGKTRVWANASAFRPVPIQLRAKAAEICEAIGARAAGFHPRALDENGKTFTEGGFYCVKD